MLIRHGHTTPDGYVITDSHFQRHLKACGLIHELLVLEQHLRQGDLAACEAMAEYICAGIVATPLDDALQEALLTLYRQQWEGRTLIVRSSAVGEDSSTHSFAGQLDSFLNVDTTEALETAVRRTWASLYSVRSITYQLRKGLYLSHMGVIVQEQIDALFSGVFFSTSPTASLSDTMVAEYCHGLAEALVSGRITPGILVFSRAGSLQDHILQPEPASNHDILTHQAALLQLSQAALTLEKVFSAPLDIEWSIDCNGVLHLLQARPITTTPPVGDTAQIAWTNANISENFPDPVCPLLYSIAIQGYAAYFRNLGLGFGIAPKRLDAMQDVLDHLIGVHGGRLYYNLTNIHALLYLTPFGPWLTSFFNEFVGASQFPSLPSAHLQGPLDRLAELARLPIMVVWKYLTLDRRIARFESTVDAFCGSAPWDSLPHLTMPLLRRQFLGFLDIRLHRWNDAALADLAAMVTYGLLEMAVKRWLKDAGSTRLHNDLLNGLEDIASSIPVLKLWELSRWVCTRPDLHRLITEHEPPILWQQMALPEYQDLHDRFAEYLEHRGFRGSGELMLTSPSPQEQPLPTLALLKRYVGLETDPPLSLMQRQSAAREAITQSILIRLTPDAWRRRPLISRAWWFQQLLRATQASIRFRERARFRQARLYVRLRHIVLAMGNRLHDLGMLDLPEDVFFLTATELCDLTAGHAMFPYSVPELTALRKQAHAALVGLTPLDNFTLSLGEYLPTGVGHSVQQPPGSTKHLVGIGACGGYVKGHAKVLQSSSEVHLLDPGDLLITRQTDPGWASVFFLIKGLVAERGGMLSHGAIIAREYGIPAVVGVTDATKIIRSGDRVAIHGDLGIVDILS
jgi:pyruvate,water dikinase